MVKDVVKGVAKEVVKDVQLFVIEVTLAIVSYDCRIDTSCHFNLASLYEDSYYFQIVAKFVATWL